MGGEFFQLRVSRDNQAFTDLRILKWTNVYFYRRYFDGTQGFEGWTNDAEIEALITAGILAG
jgi:hypothetical protein